MPLTNDFIEDCRNKESKKVIDALTSLIGEKALEKIEELKKTVYLKPVQEDVVAEGKTEMSVSEFKKNWTVVGWMKPLVDEATKNKKNLEVEFKTSPAGRHVIGLKVVD